jgi:glycosyltransferase involved in cell wall biosynthesis
MCTFNGARYLQDQLDSFVSQTRLPDELIVCDDCSSDDTEEIIRVFAREAPFKVRLFINETNLGSTKNFEKAIGLCGGDVIFLSDQDDVWLPEKLFKVEETLAQSEDAAGVLTDATIVDESLNPLGYCFWQATKFDRRQQERAMSGRLDTLIKNNSSMAGATFAFCAELRDLTLPIPAYWTHDAWIILIIAALAKLIVIPEPLNLWRQHEQQQLGSWSIKSFSEMKEIASKKDMSKDASLVRRQYASAKKRVEALEVSNPEAAETLSQLLRRLKEKAIHIDARSSMAKFRIIRIPSIAGELLSLRYFRYSSGLKSAARDFFY